MPSTLIGCTFGACIIAFRLAREMSAVVNLSFAVVLETVLAALAYTVSVGLGMVVVNLAINLLSNQSESHCFNAPLISFNMSYCVFWSSASKRETALRTNCVFTVKS